jgi:fluoride exporter
VEPDSGPQDPMPKLGRLSGVDSRELAAIFAGGCIGSIARAAMEQTVPASADSWPWATFTANIVGALALGYLITRLQERLAPSLYRRAFLGTGLCGALTTFSTLMVEVTKMADAGHWRLASGYGLASLACGLAAIFVSTKLVRRARLA